MSSPWPTRHRCWEAYLAYSPAPAAAVAGLDQLLPLPWQWRVRKLAQDAYPILSSMVLSPRGCP